MGSKAECIHESCPAIFAKCLGMIDFRFKMFSILDSNLTSYSCVIVKNKFMVSMKMPSHFSFVLGIKSLLSSIITNPTE